MNDAVNVPFYRDETDRMREALLQEFANMANRLSQLLAKDKPPGPQSGIDPAVAEASSIRLLGDLLGLSPAERTILCLSAGAELEPSIAEQCRAITGEPRPDVSLALTLAGDGAWEALCPEAPLRRWRLVEPSGQGPMLRQHLSVDERALHFLMGVNYVDARLTSLAHLAEPSRALDPRERDAAASIAEAWSRGVGALPVVLLASPDRPAAREIAAHGAHDIGLRLLALDAGDIALDPAARAALAILLDRELALSGAAVLIEAREEESVGLAQRLAERLRGPTLILATDPPVPERTPRRRIDLAAPSRSERRALWHDVLGDQAHALGSGLERLAAQFALSRPGVQAVAEAAFARPLLGASPPKPHQLMGQLWQAARVQGRRHLESLAERIESRGTWDDLVLPAEPMAQLRDLAGHICEAWRVHEDWGWAAKGERGLGAAALFAGPSGTGKTLAAEVLAGELQLDLYRIDLSQVVSKYIGETEKNLARIFVAAEDGGAILLFDEADALFGKRSEVKDSHDRYANVEVSYLLQRMEAYRGLAILTTNLKGSVDTAFLRRLRYVVSFPFPDMAARAEIWARIFPPETPRENFEPERLAKLNLTGGAIRAIALNAAFLAAGQAEPVRPAHILTAARREYAKLEKPFTQAEQGAFR